MKITAKKLALISLCAIGASANTATAVTYRITFDGLWVADQVNTGTYPGNAHFSPVVGSTHKAGMGFWQPGTLASSGVEGVAELGQTVTLQSEVNNQITAGDANSFFQVTGNLFSLPNSGSTTVTTDSTFSEVSIITMVAPSPDWFVGVYNEQLYVNGTWRPDFSVDLQTWDAGTEEGTGFGLSNPATSPAEPIALLADGASPFISQPVVARAHFELVSNPAIADLDERGVQINRIDFETQTITLRNFGGEEEALDGWRFCTHDVSTVRRYSGSSGLNGITLAPGEELSIHFMNDATGSGAVNISDLGGSFATPLSREAYGMQIYFDPVSFGDGNTIADHIQWSLEGADNTSADERSDEAETGGVWVDQSQWIATTSSSMAINLTDNSGGILHSPANYSTEEPETGVNVPLLPTLGLGALGMLLLLARNKSLR